MKPRYLVSTFASSSSKFSRRNEDLKALRSQVWHTDAPMVIGHPMRWVMTQDESGVRIRNLSGALNQVQAAHSVHLTAKRLADDPYVQLPGGRLWLKLKALDALNPVFEAPMRETHGGLTIYMCFGPWVHQATALEHDADFTAVFGKESYFRIRHKKSQVEIRALKQPLKIRQGATQTSVEPGQSITVDVDRILQVRAGDLRWVLRASDRTEKLADEETKRFALPIDKPFQRALGIAAFLLLAVCITSLLWPKNELKEQELIPQQFAKVVFSAGSPTAEPAKSSQPTTAAETAVVQSLKNDAFKQNMSALLKGGMTQLLKQSEFVSNNRRKSANQLFASSKTNGEFQATQAPVGERKVEVATLGGGAAGNPSALGYGKGGAAGVKGQGQGQVTLDYGSAAVEEGLTKEEVGKVIHAHMAEIRYCYESAMISNPDVEGKLLVDFTIGPAGLVTTSAAKQSTLGDARVDDCILRRLGRWQFPKPKGGVKVSVTYPFIFKTLGR